MKTTRIVILLISSFLCAFSLQAQISTSIPSQTAFNFSISSEKKVYGGKEWLVVHVSKEGVVVFSDSVVTAAASCVGFAMPAIQPFDDYFVFSKHEKQNGKTYILSKEGEWRIIPGGTFWAAPKDKVLFLLAERELTNLLIYDLKNWKTLVEKFNCDDFTNWYLYKGYYFGKVEMECGNEPEPEKEINEWLHPFVIEKFDLKDNSLNEAHADEKDLERAKPLVKYAGCK